MKNLFFFLAILTLGFNAKSNPNEELLAALTKKNYNKAARIFHTNVKAIDPNYVSPNSPQGPQLIYLLAQHRQFYLVKRSLKAYPALNVNEATCHCTVCKGKDLLTLLAEGEQWKLVLRILGNPEVHVSPLVLVLAAAAKQRPIVQKILALHPTIDFQFKPEDGPAKGKNALWWVVNQKQMDLFQRMLEINPNTRIDEPMGQRGTTPIWWLAAHGEWPLVVRVLQLNPQAGIYTRPLSGTNRVTAFEIAIARKEWPVVALMVGINPNTDFILDWTAVSDAPAYVKKAITLRLMLRDLASEESLQRHLNTLHGPGDLVQDLVATFRHVALAFPEVGPATIPEDSKLCCFPKDVRRLLVLKTLREQDPDLLRVPDGVIMEVLGLFQVAYKAPAYEERKLDAIEAGVLGHLCSVERRTEKSRKSIKKVRRYIREAVRTAITMGIIPPNLPQHTRALLVEAITARYTGISKITLGGLKQVIETMNVERGVQEEEMSSHEEQGESESQENKRGRAEEAEEEGETRSLKVIVRIKRPTTMTPAPQNLREGLVRDVIRDAPNLNIEAVYHRVEEMMEPMDVDMNGAGDLEDLEELFDVRALLAPELPKSPFGFDN
jgi:hypothetical protein